MNTIAYNPNTDPNNYRATGSANVVGKYLHTFVTLHYPDGSTKQIKKSTGLLAYNENGSRSKANKKAAEDMLAFRKKEAIILAVKQAQEDIEQGKAKYAKGDILFVAACEEFVAKAKLAETTREAYALSFNAHLKPYFEPRGLHLSELNEDVLQEYIDYKTETEGLQGASVKRHMAVVNGALRAAKKKKIVTSDFWIGLEYPNNEKFEGSAYTPEELQALLHACVKSPICDAVVLTAVLGLRRSEVLGLQWKNVDLENGTVRIKDVVVCVSKVHYKPTPKSASSDRTLGLSDNTVQYLKMLKAKQEQNKRDYGNTYHDNDFVCKYEDGSLILPRCLNSNFTKILERNGLRKIRFHDLRHTAATLLINDGAPVPIVQGFLGHSKPSTTLNTYTHSFKAREITETRKLGAAFSF